LSSIRIRNKMTQTFRIRIMFSIFASGPERNDGNLSLSAINSLTRVILERRLRSCRSTGGRVASSTHRSATHHVRILITSEQSNHKGRLNGAILQEGIYCVLLTKIITKWLWLISIPSIVSEVFILILIVAKR
jgi:hypothetical protein